MSSSLATFLHKHLRCCLNMCHKKSISKTEKLRFYHRAKLSIMRLAIIWTKLLQFLATFLVNQSFTQLGILQKKKTSLVWQETHFSKYFLSLKSGFPRLPLLLPLAATIAEHLRAGSSWHSNIESLDPQKILEISRKCGCNMEMAGFCSEFIWSH